MADLPDSTLLSDLGAWLRNPVIRITATDEVEELRSQLADLEQEYDKLQSEYQHVLSNYRDLTIRCCDLKDMLRANGIKVR